MAMAPDGHGETKLLDNGTIEKTSEWVPTSLNTQTVLFEAFCAISRREAE
jgi:hypothetical protein